MTFSFHRGSLALDFVGTMGARASSKPDERLPDGAALLRWLAEAGLPVPTRITQAELDTARALREAIYLLAVNSLDGKGWLPGAVNLVNRAALGPVGGRRLFARDRIRWVTNAPLKLAFARIAEDAVLFLGRDARRLTRCKLPDCGALLLSSSRGDPRRWCSMETCGNRAKVANFRARMRRRKARPAAEKLARR
jgi:predicted RNA-binding Zn ribbon-like protein